MATTERDGATASSELSPGHAAESFFDGVLVAKAADMVPSQNTAGREGHRALQPPPLDFRLADRSEGSVRCVAHFLPIPGMSRATFATTGWHLHDCVLQFAWVAKGSVEIVFDDRAPIRAEAGDLMIIPGGVPHVARTPTDDYATIELTVPGDFGTTPCEPVVGRPTLGAVVRRRTTADTRQWVAQEYSLPITDYPLEITRLEAGAGAFDISAGSRQYVTLLMTSGDCQLRTTEDNVDHALTRFDVVMIGPGQTASIVSASDDFEALQLHSPAVALTA